MPVHREPESSDKWYHVRSGSEKQKLRASPKELEIFVKIAYLKFSKGKKNSEVIQQNFKSSTHTTLLLLLKTLSRRGKLAEEPAWPTVISDVHFQYRVWPK